MEHFSTGNRTGRIGSPHGYLPIEEHGIVGDLRTVALIGTDGTVDWFCPARFDAPSLFGALLDKDKGGYFSVAARTSYAKPKQRYLPDTNILLTRFQGRDAVGEVIDFMVPETRPVGKARDLLVRHARSRARPGSRSPAIRRSTTAGSAIGSRSSREWERSSPRPSAGSCCGPTSASRSRRPESRRRSR